MFIVYVTKGEYSYYSMESVYVGEKDPAPLLDALVVEMSGGRWIKFDDIREGNTLTFTDGKYDIAETERKRKLTKAIREKLVPLLVANGFVESQATEVWLGS